MENPDNGFLFFSFLFPRYPFKALYMRRIYKRIETIVTNNLKTRENGKSN